MRRGILVRCAKIEERELTKRWRSSASTVIVQKKLDKKFDNPFRLATMKLYKLIPRKRTRKNMNIATIMQKKNVTKADFAILSEEEVLSPTQERTLARAEQRLREGKALSLDELRNKLGFND